MIYPVASVFLQGLFSIMEQQEMIPHLFRTEYSKIVSVLSKWVGFENIEIAEDIASDTFLLATETWGIKGLPENPVAWLYVVAKNRAKDHLKRSSIFSDKITPGLQQTHTELHEPDIDLSDKNIIDSQLQMMFAICHPSIPAEAQIGLSLRILCGFGIEEIADAFLTNKETINKRLFRAKEKLRAGKVKLEFPAAAEMDKRLETVLTTLYLLFNEGYYSLSQNVTVRKDLCFEAMRLNFLLLENATTNKPKVNALLAVMCFHASRFEARTSPNGESILYEDQDTNLWNDGLIKQGEFYLNRASEGNELSKYHIEAAIAHHHTNKSDSPEKWENILQLYNRLLLIEYSPAAALNRAYAVARADGKLIAIRDAEKLNLVKNHLYYLLLGYLYTDGDDEQAIAHLKTALKLAKSKTDKDNITKSINKIKK
jgi:RNA polymerase sigma factor (sigma-70 family)